MLLMEKIVIACQEWYIFQLCLKQKASQIYIHDWNLIIVQNSHELGQFCRF